MPWSRPRLSLQCNQLRLDTERNDGARVKDDNRLKWFCVILACLCILLAAMAVDHSQASHEIREAEYWPTFLGIKLKITDTLVVILTAALAYYTNALNQSTLKLWQAGERQNDTAAKAAEAAAASARVARDALVASNRAWIVGRMNLTDQPLSFGNGGLYTSVSFDLVNTGAAPALNVSCHAWLLSSYIADGGTIQSRNAEMCERFKGAQPIVKTCMFPGQSLSDATGYALIMLQAIMPKQEFDNGLLKDQPIGDVIPAHLGGVVNYQFTTDPERVHQTSFLYEVKRNSPPYYMVVGAGDVPSAELELQVPINGGQSAD